MTAEPPPDRCGSTSGYQAHLDNGTPSCQRCRDAQAAWQRQYRKRLYLAGGLMQVDGTGTRRRVQALCRVGWSCGELGARLGVSAQQVSNWTRESMVYRETAARIAALYDELWDQPGGSKHAANRAAAKGWLPPMAWDDAGIDDPNYMPELSPSDPRGMPLDEVAIQRAMRGRPPERLSRAERLEVVRRLTDQHVSSQEIASRLGVRKRQVDRDRADLTRSANGARRSA